MNEQCLHIVAGPTLPDKTPCPLCGVAIEVWIPIASDDGPIFLLGDSLGITSGEEDQDE